MKKIFLTLPASLLFIFQGYSQTINNIPFKDIKAEYIQLTATTKGLSNNIILYIDFGQKNGITTSQKNELKDSTDNAMVFNSMMDALNFMSQNNYELVQAYTSTIAGRTDFANCYILRRKKNS